MGNLTNQTDANGQVTTLSYDGLNRLIGKTFSTGDTPITYTYDENGHTGYRTSMTDASGETHWQYDPKGRVVEEVKQILNNPFTTQWTYDSQDRITLMTYPDGEKLYYAYLKQSGIKTVNSNRAKLLVNTLVNDNGKVKEQSFADLGTNASYKTTYGYYNWIEGAGRLKSISSSKKLSEDSRRWFVGQVFGYDQVGNITHVTDNLNNYQQLNFDYDALNRLISASVAGGNHGYYDPQVYSYNKETGNLASKTGVGHYTYSAQKPHAVIRAGHYSFDYDANGNMTQRNLPGDAGNFEYVYNAENKIVEIKKNGVTTRRFVYDGDGNRVYEIVFDGFEDTKPEETFYIGNYYQQKVQGEKLLTDQIEAVTAQYMSYYPLMHKERGKGNTSYYYADGKRFAMRVEGAYYYIFGDHLGSTTSVVQRNNGERVGYQLYEPWGTTRYSSGTSRTTYAYTGQMQVDDIYYYNARWYDPMLGRFMQADTIVPSHQGTQGFDRYAYVNNNPLKYTDPTGHYACQENGDCLIKDWNDDYIIRQEGNTCGVVAMAMALSNFTGRKYSQTEVQMPFFWTKEAPVIGPIKYPGVGVLPRSLSFITNRSFGSLIKTTLDKRGSIEKIDENLQNDLPTIILFGLPTKDGVGHYVLIVGKSKDKGYIIADPHGYRNYEAGFVSEYGNYTNSSSFQDIWGYEGQSFVGSFNMITVQPSSRNWFYALQNLSTGSRTRTPFMSLEKSQ